MAGPVTREASAGVDPAELSFLAEAGALLASTLDYETTLARVADLVVPRLADWCVFDLVDEGDGVRRVAVVCADPAKASLARELREGYPARPGRAEGTAKVLATGRAELIADVSRDWLAAIAPNPQQAEILLGLGIRSNILVPLVARGRVIGVLTMATAESGRRYGAQDLALAEELASRAAMAVDNARLFREAHESSAALDALLATAPIGLAFLDRGLKLVRVNDTLAALGTLPRAEQVGRSVQEVLPSLASQIEPALRRVLESEAPVLNCELSGETAGDQGVRRHWLASFYPVRADADVPGVGMVVAEITDRRRAEDRLATQHAVTRILAESPSLADAAPRILQALCESLAWELGALWTVDREADLLRCADMWYPPSLDASRFETLSRRIPLPRGVGLLGRVWETGRAAWVSDVTRDPDSRRAAAAALSGLHSALAFPIVIAGEPIGAVEVYTRRPEQPDRDLLRALAVVGGQIGQFIERKEAEQERLRLLAREHVARADAEDAERRLALLSEASAILATSPDYEPALERIAGLAVPGLASWCAVDLVEPGGSLRRVALRSADPGQAPLALPEPADPERVARTGRAELLPDLTFERGDARSYMCAPLEAGGRVLGVLVLVAAPGRRYTEDDLALARELGRRAAVAIENARLQRETQERAHAANVLTHVADGVFLLDESGVVRLWNPAAERITGLAASEVVGRSADEAIPRWSEVAESVPLVESGAAGRAVTLPLSFGDRSVWLSISGAGFAEGTVYAFRDLTEERAVEKMKTDFVSTVSHELRTPLAAIYGSALTLHRDDVSIPDDRRRRLLDVIVDESDRLARIVEDILWASRIDSGTLSFAIEECDARALAEAVVETAKVHAPTEVELSVTAPPEPALVRADRDKLRQVLANLVENAIKYSPDGGRIDVALARVDGRLRLAVTDQGIGVPSGEQERIFEKFYRLDPELTRGVGGTGLGLYICRELMLRMEGRIWLEPKPRGSTFVVELQLAR